MSETYRQGLAAVTKELKRLAERDYRAEWLQECAQYRTKTRLDVNAKLRGTVNAVACEFVAEDRQGLEAVVLHFADGRMIRVGADGSDAGGELEIRDEAEPQGRP